MTFDDFYNLEFKNNTNKNLYDIYGVSSEAKELSQIKILTILFKKMIEANLLEVPALSNENNEYMLTKILGEHNGQVVVTEFTKDEYELLGNMKVISNKIDLENQIEFLDNEVSKEIIKEILLVLREINYCNII